MSITAQLERYQVPLYLVALAVGFIFPVDSLRSLVEPALAILLFMTFMAIPLNKVHWDGHFAGHVLALNFIAVPIVAVALAAFLPEPQLYIPFLIVLLCPCVDYVIVFCRLAGGAADKLLTLTPALLGIQLVVMPTIVAAVAFIRGGVGVELAVAPFIRAFLLLIAFPLLTAWFIQRSRIKERVERLSENWMAPVMAIVLFFISSGYSGNLATIVGDLVGIAVLYAIFGTAMAGIGFWWSRCANQGREVAIAMSFTAATRNSLVIMPIVLALPAGFESAPAIVLTQTMVELILMVIFVSFSRLKSDKTTV